MANTIKLIATKRVSHGSGEARRVRRAGSITAAITRINHETDTFQINAHDYMMAMRGETAKQVLVELVIDGVSSHAILREVQRDVITNEPINVDFSEVDMTKKIRTAVTVKLVGEPEGVRVQNGVLAQAAHEINIECLPTDLVEFFEFDVSAMKVNETLTVADLKLDPKYTVLTRGETTVATVSSVADDAPAAAAAPAADAKAAPAAPAKK